MTSLELSAEFVDLEQAALAEADRKFGDIHGLPDDWSDAEWGEYEHLLDRVRHVFHSEQAQAGTELAA